LCTTNPVEVTYLHVWAQQLDTATVADYEFSIVMSFDVEFFDKKVLSPSMVASAVSRVARVTQSSPQESEEEEEPPPVVVRRPARVARA